MSKLTDIKCKNAKPLDPPSKAPRKLADGNGLYLWVMPNGNKYWRFRYRDVEGKEKALSFGVYPEISLAEARDNGTMANQSTILRSVLLLFFCAPDMTTPF